MASDGNSGQTPITSLVHGSQAPVAVSVQKQSGKSLPAGGKETVAAAAHSDEQPPVRAQPEIRAQPPVTARPPGPARPPVTAQSLVTALNRHLNDSGRPDGYRVAPNSEDKLIQQINPATGEVIGQFSASEFPLLARSAGVAGALIDSHA